MLIFSIGSQLDIMMRIPTNKGFTLIELVIVIIILAILAVVAVPKYISLQKEAQLSTLAGLAASLKTMQQQVFNKAVIEGKETGRTTLTYQGHNIDLINGSPYPTISNIAPLIDVGQGHQTSCKANPSTGLCRFGDWDLFIPTSQDPAIYFMLPTIGNTNCYVGYTANNGQTNAQVITRTTGC